jgi:hypothetical protein
MTYSRRMMFADDGFMEAAPVYQIRALQNKDGSPQWGVRECRIRTFKNLLIEFVISRVPFPALVFPTPELTSD